jgi:UDP:flavonoid glycosyltransferase YjiC (YdhE family)
MKPSDSVVVFGTPERGHTKRLIPIISGLTRAGIRTHVFTMPCFRTEIEEAGGLYINLFRGRSLDEADALSTPIPCRYVSFAGHYAEQIISEARVLKPSLVLHDAFAVIGEVVAGHLGVPRVNVCVGHNYAPEAALEALLHDPRVNISENCWRAVRVLREKYGMAHASPFSYVTGMSSDLNLYCEPPQYLPDDMRKPFQPVAFLGSLSEQTISRAPLAVSPYGKDATVNQRIYISLGTVIWRYYEAAARGVLETIREVVADVPEFTALVSLGDAQPGDWVRRLEMPNFRVESYVDQWSVLGASTIFITHHGLNSTHEAVFHKVPMISYPFFADQPALARYSQDMGIAIPLSSELRGRVSAEDVRSALSNMAARRKDMLERLSEARQWELDVIARRGHVIQRILDLAL